MNQRVWIFPFLHTSWKIACKRKRLPRSPFTWLPTYAGTHQTNTRMSLLCHPFFYKPSDKNWMQLEASAWSPRYFVPSAIRHEKLIRKATKKTTKKKKQCRTPPPFPNKDEQTPRSFSSFPEAQPISHEWLWLGKGLLWGDRFAAAASTPCQWRQGASSACPAVAGNPLECIRSAKMNQKYSPQPLTLEYPSVIKGVVRFWQCFFRTAAFGPRGNHMRAVPRRAVADFEHPSDNMGFLYFSEATWCCSLTRLSV